MERRVTFIEGEYYHIYNRGVDRREIFSTPVDYWRFQRLLFLSNGTAPFIFREVQKKKFSDIERQKPLVAIGSYCLMPNHFHILVKEITDNGISMFMEKLATGYSMYFNKKNKRTGTLFQGPFKAEHIGDDNYLKYLFAYIHLNPIKLIEPNWKEQGIKNSTKSMSYLRQFQYSSYLDYVGTKREENAIIKPKEFPNYFEKSHEFKDFVRDWLDFEQESDAK